jgi:hypothetical protein
MTDWIKIMEPFENLGKDNQPPKSRKLYLRLAPTE